jgi:N6-L-threonylcarbamoyladenine synthase
MATGEPDRPGGLILGIESSCDETAAAVVRAGGEVLANVVASQIALHADYGGVVPELASREHLRNIVPVVRAAMAQAARVQPGLTFADLDAIAVTEGPGLAGALLVGVTYAKALALGLGKPLIAVNHLEGHIHAVLMQEAGNRGQGTASRPGPLLALVVSGGHTHLYLAEQLGVPHFASEMWAEAPPAPGVWAYRNVGRTVDDAAGEAFDKVAKLLGLGYPGGPWMDALAAHGNPRAVEFKFQQIKPRRGAETRSRLDSGDSDGLHPTLSAEDAERMGHPGDLGQQSFDFSFSGIKTAVLRYIQTRGMGAVIEARRKALAAALKANPALKPGDALREMPQLFDAQTLDLIASFQHAVVGNLIKQTAAAADHYGAKGVIVSGGVSANSELRRRFAEALPLLIDFKKWMRWDPKTASKRDFPVEFPTLAMSTDNAAMIAAAAWPKFVAGEFAADGLVAAPQLKLG